MSQPTQEAESNRGKVLERVAQGEDAVKTIAKWFEQPEDKPWEQVPTGQSRTYIFVLNKTEKVEKDFKGQKKIQYRFTVVTEDNKEKTLDLSERWAKMIFELLAEGWQKLRLTRTGESMNTEYRIVPVQQ
jgi:hypothetical protein